MIASAFVFNDMTLLEQLAEGKNSQF